MYVDEMERDSNGQLLADTDPSASGCATACAKPRDFLPRATGADPLPPLSFDECCRSTSRLSGRFGGAPRRKSGPLQPLVKLRTGIHPAEKITSL